MKNPYIISSICLLLGVLGSACSTEVHHDSISTAIVVDIAKENAEKPIIVHQRYAFDRDLIPLKTMELDDAWLDRPDLSKYIEKDSVNDKGNETQKDKLSGIDLSIVKSVGISLVDKGMPESVFWLYARPRAGYTDKALFSEMNVGDLRSYMSEDDMLLEIEAEITLDPYHVMRYWRDVCHLSDSCELVLPLSMQFKMED